jgi:hypothetical protein
MKEQRNEKRERTEKEERQNKREEGERALVITYISGVQ